ncbi:MAG: ATP-binding cassette domain-containing protein [Acidimicrobiales bacterium]
MIRVDGLRKSLGDAEILRGVTFTAPTGTITGLLGPNGAGKTTTMRVLATLLRPDHGTVEIDGLDVAAHAQDVRRRIGLVTEEPGLFERLTGREQLRFVAEVHGMGRRAGDEAIDRLADAFGFGADVDRRAGELSKGNRQKLSLARALVHDPPVLLLDEPTANLDVVASSALEAVLLTPGVVTGRTVLLSTHSVEEAERLCQRVVGLVQGTVVADSTPEALVADLGATDFRSAFVGLLGRAALDLPA